MLEAKMKAFVGYLLVLSFVLCSVNCLRIEKVSQCEKHGEYSAYPDDCTKYFMCFQGNLLKFQCPWGLHWNAQLKFCDMPEGANCNGTPEEPVAIKPKPITKCEQHGVYTADPDNCANYFMCFQGQLKKYRCHWGLHWNDKLKKCQSPEEANCNGKPDETGTETETPLPAETTDAPVADKKEKLKVVCYCKEIRVDFNRLF